MAYYRLPEKELRSYCEAVMGKYGFNEKQSRDIADILLTADLQGLESHGVQRLIRYHRGVKSGVIRPDAVPEVVHETPLSVVLDAHSAMGQIAAVDAMERAIAKAKQYGFGAAVVMMTILPALMSATRSSIGSNAISLIFRSSVKSLFRGKPGGYRLRARSDSHSLRPFRPAGSAPFRRRRAGSACRS